MDADRFSRPGFGGPRITPAQAVACGVVVAAVGWSLWLLQDRPVREEVELLPGTALPSSELAIIEAAFDRAQLADHRTEDGRVWVPRARQSAYMRALVDAEALPREFGSSLRRALERHSPWQSRAAQEELLRVALQEELAHVICSMPGIERAAVLYDVDHRSGFDGSLARQPVRTASVNIRTQPDTELEPARVQAIRVLVAASIAGLAADRVAVTDLRSGRVHAGPLAESGGPAAEEAALAAVDPALARRVAHERHLAAKVRQALAFIRGVVVDVTVGFPGESSGGEPAVEPALPGRQQRVADANAPAEIPLPGGHGDPGSAGHARPAAVAPGGPAEPRSICVSVAVPETYFDAAIRAGLDRAGAADPTVAARGEEERIRDHVLRALPPAAGPGERRVVVTTVPVVAGRTAAWSPTAAGGRGAQAASVSLRRPSADSVPGGDLFHVAWQALAAGRPSEAPREAWIVIIIACGGTLALLIGRSGGLAHGPSPARRRKSEQRLDWSAVTPETAAARTAADDTASRAAA